MFLKNEASSKCSQHDRKSWPEDNSVLYSSNFNVHWNHLGSYNNAEPDSADLGWSLSRHISRELLGDIDDRGHTLSGLAFGANQVLFYRLAN